MTAKSKKAGRAAKRSSSSSSSSVSSSIHAASSHGIEGRIDALAEILRRHELHELEIEEGDVRIYLRRGHEPHGGHAAPPPPSHTPAVNHAPLALAATPATHGPTPSKTDASDGNVLYVTSPFVGTFYRSPSPESASFVDVGTRIKKGQVLCIVEAMKLMNEIESEIEGAIVQILVENGQAVEYGEPLFKIKQG